MLRESDVSPLYLIINSMILIISQKSDFATTQVISWLVYFKKKFIRLNGDDDYKFVKIDPNELLVEKDGNTMNLIECNSYWYRRNGIFLQHLGGNLQKLVQDKTTPKCFITTINSEFESLRVHIYKLLENNSNVHKRLSSFFSRSVNKLEVIKQAEASGLKVPYTALVSTKSALVEMLKKRNIITKAVDESIYSSEDRFFYTAYTSRITVNDLKEIPEIFMMSLVQEEIEKKYELRIFFVKKKIYSSVVFSQDDKESMVDCRRAVNFRYLPYKLPREIEDNLRKLMSRLKLNSGSIDMIVDSNNQYIFLEVNPVGQFVAYGEYCNYYLDKEIAKLL